MSIRIDQEQAATFVQQALRRALPGVALTVSAYREEGGRPGLRAEWTDARTGESGARTFVLPHPERPQWDAGSLVAMAVQHFTAAFEGRAGERSRAA